MFLGRFLHVFVPSDTRMNTPQFTYVMADDVITASHDRTSQGLIKGFPQLQEKLVHSHYKVRCLMSSRLDLQRLLVGHLGPYCALRVGVSLSLVRYNVPLDT